MKTHPCRRRKWIAASLSISLLATGIDADAAVIYRGLQNIPVPTDFDGVFVNLDNGATGVTEFTGWDFNPFFGGFGATNSASFQPARTSATSGAPLISLPLGTVILGSLLFGTGDGISSGYVGNGLNQFAPDAESYVGFQFTPDGGGGPHFGWIRVVFTANGVGGLLKDWAYEDSGAPIVAGNVLQSAPVGGVSLVTLSGELGESATLGALLPALPGVTLQITKTGEGTWVIATPQDDAVLNAGAGTTIINTALDNASITVASAANLEILQSQTLESLTINDGGIAQLGTSFVQTAPPLDGLVQPIPEPTGFALWALGSVVTFASRRFATARTRRP